MNLPTTMLFFSKGFANFSRLKETRSGIRPHNRDSSKVRLIGLVFILASLISGCDFLSPPRPGKEAIETWETKNPTFRIRVTAYPEENGGFVPGAYYVFQSSPARSNDWKEIMTFRRDDAVKIPREQIVFVNDNIGYIFMGWMYAITTDAGTTWSVWDAKKDLPDWECCNYVLIQKVDLAPNGVGTMTLTPITQRRGEVPKLFTKDYGRHWSAQ